MTTRLRWYKFRLDQKQLRRVADGFARAQYVTGAQQGVKLQSSTRTELSGEFVERREFNDEITDPAGQKISIQRLEFWRLPFRITTHEPGLEVAGAARARSTFFDLLKTLTSHEAGIESIVVDPLKWLSAIEAAVGRATVTALHVRDVPLSLSSSATMWVSGTRDVRRGLGEFLGKRKGDIDRVRVALKVENDVVDVELSRFARAAISTGADDLRETLARSLVAAGDGARKTAV